MKNRDEMIRRVSEVLTGPEALIAIDLLDEQLALAETQWRSDVAGRLLELLAERGAGFITVGAFAGGIEQIASELEADKPAGAGGGDGK